MLLKLLGSRLKTLLPCLPSPNTIFSYSSGVGGRHKKKIYHRVPDLDKAMNLQKKPALLLRLRSVICAQQSRSLLLRDLEKEVGFVKKWNFVSLIEKHPTVFKVLGGGTSRSPISVRLTDKADRISCNEARARQLMEPILVRHLRKLLMMSLDCRVPLQKIELIQIELGLPKNFRECLVPKYPEFFSVKCVNGLEYLNLESWDSTLAVTAREDSLDLETLKVESKKAVGRDGNFPGPRAFKINYAPGFRPNVHYLEEVQKWQKMAFPSPYLSARRIDPATPQARKRAVAVLHELLSLTMEKRLPSNKLDAFHNEYQLPYENKTPPLEATSGLLNFPHTHLKVSCVIECSFPSTISELCEASRLHPFLSASGESKRSWCTCLQMNTAETPSSATCANQHMF